MHRDRKILIRAVIIGGVVILALAVALIILNNSEKARYAESRENMSAGFGQLRTVEIGGETYREKPAITTLLIAGIDKDGTRQNSDVVSYRNGGQADFLLLLAIDHTEKKIHQLQIDRDTMTPVSVLGVFGNEVGTRVLQICLAHSFGATPQDNAKYTVKAVQNLLEGIEVDGYYMVDYSAIPVLNDALGGVPVKINYDMTAVNPDWKEGSTVTLRGKEAEAFVRARRNVGSGENVERMDRQNEFMRSAIERMRKKLGENSGFGEELLNLLQDIAVSNMTVKRLADEMVKARDYEILEVDHPEGEHVISTQNVMEFHMKEGAALNWVLNHMYVKQ